MNGLQYKHYPEYKRTYAVHPPALSKMEEAMAHHIVDAPFQLLVALGAARVHPNDTYSKAEGRKVSFSKIKMIKMKIIAFTSFDTGSIDVVLSGGGYKIYLNVRKNREVPIVREVYSKRH